MSRYGKLPGLLDEVCYRIGQAKVHAWTLAEIQRLQQVRDVMMDEAETMELIDAACEMQEHIDRALNRNGYVPCVLAIIRCWQALGEEDSVKKMSRTLIDMVDVDAITKLGLVGEFL
jgi:hypothetical protein